MVELVRTEKGGARARLASVIGWLNYLGGLERVDLSVTRGLHVISSRNRIMKVNIS